MSLTTTQTALDGLADNLVAIARHLDRHPDSPLTRDLFARWAAQQLTGATPTGVMAIPGVAGDFLEHYRGQWATIADAITELSDEDAPAWMREQAGGSGSEVIAERFVETGWVTAVWTPEGFVHIWQSLGRWPDALPDPDEIQRIYSPGSTPTAQGRLLCALGMVGHCSDALALAELLAALEHLDLGDDCATTLAVQAASWRLSQA